MVEVKALQNRYIQDGTYSCANFTGLRIKQNGKTTYIRWRYTYSLKDGYVHLVSSYGEQVSFRNSEFPLSRIDSMSQAFASSGGSVTPPPADDILYGEVNVTSKSGITVTYASAISSANVPICQVRISGASDKNKYPVVFDVGTTGFKVRLMDSTGNPTTGKIGYIVKK